MKKSYVKTSLSSALALTIVAALASCATPAENGTNSTTNTTVASIEVSNTTANSTSDVVLTESEIVSTEHDSAENTSNVETVIEEEEVILHSDDFFDVELMKFYEAEGIDASYLQLKISNKSDQKLTLHLKDAYVNDIAVQTGSGLPIQVEAGKISTSPFILFTANTGLKVDDISKIEFVLAGYGESITLVHSTDKIIIER